MSKIAGLYPEIHDTKAHDKTVRLGNPLWLPAYWTWIGNAGGGSLTGVANRVFIHPVYFPRAMTVSRVSINVVTAGGAGTNLRIGLYADNGGTPDGGALLGDSGDIAADSTGAKTFTLATPIAFKRGITAWVALLTADATIVLRAIAGTTFWVEVGSEKMLGCRYDLGAYGALTDPCPTTTSLSNSRFNAFLRVDSVDE